VAAFRIVRSNFRDLHAYRLSAELGNDLHEVIAGWDSFNRWSLGVQLMRSVDSIAANIAEAAGRWHRPDERRFLFIARGSLYETEHWLASAVERGLLTGEWEERLEAVARTLSGLISASGRS
jgi:four helix bundle protein